MPILLEERVERLEHQNTILARQNRGYRMFCLASMLAFLSAIVIGAMPERADVVTAHTFRLLDSDGNVRGQWTTENIPEDLIAQVPVNKEDADAVDNIKAVMRFYDSDQKTRVSILERGKYGGQLVVEGDTLAGYYTDDVFGIADKQSDTYNRSFKDNIYIRLKGREVFRAVR